MSCAIKVCNGSYTKPTIGPKGNLSRLSANGHFQSRPHCGHVGHSDEFRLTHKRNVPSGVKNYSQNRAIIGSEPELQVI
jgi:hypothetical protein